MERLVLFHIIHKKAFTMLELIFAITILAIVGIFAVPNLLDSISAAKENTLMYNLSYIRKSISKYYTTTGAYPRSLNVLEIEGFVPKVPIDPTTGKVDWEVAVNYWKEDSVNNIGEFIDGWLVEYNDTSEIIRFAGPDFIVPLQYKEPYFDKLPDVNLDGVFDLDGSTPIYRSMGGIRNIRSRKRMEIASGSTGDSMAPFDYDPHHLKLGRPIYQFFKVNIEKHSDNTINYYPYYLIEKNTGAFPQTLSTLTLKNYPTPEYVFDKEAGNYEYYINDITADGIRKIIKNQAADIYVGQTMSSYYDYYRVIP